MPQATSGVSWGLFMLFDNIITALVEQGYAVIEHAFAPEFENHLYTHAKQLQQSQLKQAAIGRESDENINNTVRRDKIKWMDQQQATEALWLDKMEQLRIELNRSLYLGLFSYEAHFAQYQIGDFYKKHLDSFKGQANRILSTVYYLNPVWQAENGGELVIYHPENHQQEITRVQPNCGTLVIFLSEEFPHEVLPAKQARYSIAGWFRVNTSMGKQIDPPR